MAGPKRSPKPPRMDKRIEFSKRMGHTVSGKELTGAERKHRRMQQQINNKKFFKSFKKMFGF